MNSDGNKEDNHTPSPLQFVDVGVVSQGERERNQKLIRSTAMRSFRRKQQSERLLENEQSGKDVATRSKRRLSKSETYPRSARQETSPIVNSGLSDAGLVNLSRLMSVSSPGDDTENNFPFVDLDPSTSLNSQNTPALNILASPCSLLGAGRIDPFRLQPVDTGSHINELVDHGELRVNCSDLAYSVPCC